MTTATGGRGPRCLVAPDKFKGSLTAAAAADAIAAGITDAVPDAVVVRLPVADGGDGTVDAQFAKIAGEGFTKDVYGTFTKTPDMLEDADQWIAAYKKISGGKDPGPYSIQTYDAVRVVAEGMKSAKSTDGAKVREAISKIDGLELSSGPLKFTDEGTLSGGGFVIVTVGPDGSFVLFDDLLDD